ARRSQCGLEGVHMYAQLQTSLCQHPGHPDPGHPDPGHPGHIAAGTAAWRHGRQGWRIQVGCCGRGAALVDGFDGKK
ncbi:MAG: hypothetical protein ACK5QX_01180, partial [bacterium]